MISGENLRQFASLQWLWWSEELLSWKWDERLVYDSIIHWQVQTITHLSCEWAEHLIHYNVLNCLKNVKINFRFQRVHLQYISPAIFIFEFKQCIKKNNLWAFSPDQFIIKSESFQSKALSGIDSLTLKLSQMHRVLWTLTFCPIKEY